MNISKLFDKKDVVFSFEIFPPKAIYPIDTIYDTLEALGDLNPDYISVTYGAGGTVRNNRTCELSSVIKSRLKIEPVAHLTCVGSTKEDLNIILGELKEKGIQNILGLRGDIPEGQEISGDFHYASELIEFIKSVGDFNVLGACYPEKHLECDTFEHDIENLKIKVDKGVGHLVTQLFYDNNNFYDFMDKIRQKNINVPVTAGIMPVTSKSQINRMIKMCGAKVPDKYLKMVEKFGDDKNAITDAGIYYATEQIIDLIANGVEGIHLYTMNNPYVARKISLYMKNIIK